jgi:crotonobetainyl-CoA:carnitine CoA-transferase CaiB-like acyl-CoA transferase
MYEAMQGIRVVEFATFAMVPAATAMLADWGADVIKIESPAGGDPTRGLFITDLGPNSPNIMTEQHNRGKRSMAIDITHVAGKKIFDDLIDKADVFVTNSLPHTRQKLKIDVERLQARNPRLIYARGSGYGTRGDDADKGAFDLSAAWARSGMCYRITPPGQVPRQNPPGFVDSVAALAVVAGIAGALFERERTGVAQVVDASLLATGSWMMAADILGSEFMKEGMLPVRERTEVINPLATCYETKYHRWIFLVGLQPDRYWVDFCHAIGRDDLLKDPRFADTAKLFENGRACITELDAVFIQKSLDEWRSTFEDFRGPWAPVQTLFEVHSDPQVVANGILPQIQSDGRRFKVVASPIQFGENLLEGLERAPELGEHTDSILEEMGYSMDEIIQLKIDDAIL